MASSRVVTDAQIRINYIDLTKDSPDVSIQVESHRRHVKLPRRLDLATARRLYNDPRRVAPIFTMEDLAENPYELENLLELENHIRDYANARRSAAAAENIIELDDEFEEEKVYVIESDSEEPEKRQSLTCPICLDSLSSKQKPTTTKCGHVFCSTCLKMVIRMSKKCPTCKTNISLKSCIRLYL